MNRPPGVALDNAFTKCRCCGIIYALIAPAGERCHDDTDNIYMGCRSPLPPNPRTSDDHNNCFSCFSCGITEGYGTTGKKIKRRFTTQQRNKGSLARCKTCVSKGRRHQFLSFDEECSYPDKSPGNDLHQAISRWDIQAVSSLLEAGVDPNYARQASLFIKKRVYGLFGVSLWNQDGTILQDIYSDGDQPTRPLSRVAFMLSANVGISINTYNEEYQNNLNAIARMLIDAGATMTPAVEMMRRRYGYEYENFEESDWNSSYPTAITLWKAQNSIRKLLERCRKQDSGEDCDHFFDFGGYFKGTNEATTSDDNITFLLTEKAVQASEDLLPFYQAYWLRRATARLSSQRSSLFGGTAQHEGLRRQDGTLLPALQKEIEARIRALALLSVNKNPILATEIPDPLT